MSELYFVAGASGSGKTAILPDLKKIFSDAIAMYDFDDIGLPEGADKKWRQEATEKWSSWLRMHHQDPKWMQHVLKDDCWQELDFSTWEQLPNWDTKAIVAILDTTKLSINQVAKFVADWIIKSE